MRSLFVFLKTNSRLITKMMINQFGMTFFGLVLAMATSQNEILLLATSIFSFLFYMFLLYTTVWEAGASDKIRVDAGRLAYEPFKGMWVSLAANFINLVLGILAVLGYVFIDKATIATTPSPEWAANLYGVCNAVARFIQAMYLGIIQYFMPNNPIGLILIVLPALAVCGLGYYIGLKGRTIRQILGIKA